MRSRYLFTIALLVATGVGWWLFNSGQPPSTAVPKDENELARHASEPGPRSTPSGGKSTAVADQRQRVEELQLALQSIVTERGRLEAKLQLAEREVTRLERYVEDIEQRGEDPVDYADEGLAMFQPAFYAYQDASEKLELAEAMEKTASEELAVAESKLANTLASLRRN